MAEPLLEIDGVTKVYRGRKVLEVPSFEAKTGDRIQITGGNGSGKSTLLRIITGISTPSKGKVKRHGAWRQRAVGFVPQDGGLHRELTLRSNAGIVWSGMNATWDATVFLTMLDRFQLEEYIDQPVQTLSDGMRRMAAIATIVAANPGLLILDEPMTGLDPGSIARLQDLLINDCRQMHAIFVTSHVAQTELVGWRDFSLKSREP